MPEKMLKNERSPLLIFRELSRGLSLQPAFICGPRGAYLFSIAMPLLFPAVGEAGETLRQTFLRGFFVASDAGDP